MTTWNAPPQFSEAKYFAIAVYNITVLGGATYFLGAFIGETNAAAGVALHCFGIFISSTVAVAVIVTPKILAINGVTKIPLYATGKSVDDHSPASFIEPEVEHIPLPIRQQLSKAGRSSLAVENDGTLFQRIDLEKDDLDDYEDYYGEDVVDHLDDLGVDSPTARDISTADGGSRSAKLSARDISTADGGSRSAKIHPVDNFVGLPMVVAQD